MTTQLNLAVIPARGGSRGIARKNLQVVGGMPLVARTVRTAMASGVFAAVVVSTDDDEIAEVARAHGATVAKRPRELARDTSPTEPVIEHALAEAERLAGRLFDTIWLLQATSPFLQEGDIRQAWQLLESGTCDSVVAVHTDHPFSWDATADGLVVATYEPAKRSRRQDIPSHYRENGALYAVTRALWDESHVRIAGRVAPLVMPAWRSLDVDDESDLEAAQALSCCLERASSEATQKLASVKAVALDFDGVMTDDKVILDEHGTEAVVCSRRDGLGIARLRDAGIHVAVFSTEKNTVVRRRCHKLRIQCFQDLANKRATVRQWLTGLGLSWEELAFVGNDVNDRECLRQAGVAVIPADAHAGLVCEAQVVLRCRGGEGAVREVADLILGSR